MKAGAAMVEGARVGRGESVQGRGRAVSQQEILSVAAYYSLLARPDRVNLLLRGASVPTLVRRVCYGGRKGRRALRRLSDLSHRWSAVPSVPSYIQQCVIHAGALFSPVGERPSFRNRTDAEVGP